MDSIHIIEGKKRPMSDAYYTYRIQIANRDRVQVNKVNPQRQNLGQPSGAFGYKDALKEQIDAYIVQAKAKELRQDEQVKGLGEALFNALFDPVLRQDFVSLYNQAVHQENKLLRIELDIDERALPDVAALPWEFMRLPTDANLGTLWVGSAPDLIFSRRRSQWFVPNPIQLKEGEKLRIGLAVAAPGDLGDVEYTKVVEGLEKLAEKKPDQFELLPVLNNADPTSLDDLLAKEPHVLHFIGHGQLVEEGIRTEGQIALVDDILGDAMWVGADFFAELLNRHRPGIVMLQACEGGMLSSSQAFVGAASRIVQQNIPVVVAMQYEVSNSTAVRFALKFYQEVADGSPVDRAAQNGRRAIGLATQYKMRDFATPVIFMRVEDGHLFVREGQPKPGPAADAAGGNGAAAPLPGQTDVPLTQDASAIPDLISNNFNMGELRDLCAAVHIDIENLGSSTKSGIARDLHGKAARTGQLDELMLAIANMRPDLVDELKANLYVFMENLKERELTALCQKLELDCVALQLDKRGLLGYAHNKHIRTERTQALQDAMVNADRYPELVQALKQSLPRVKFDIFEM